MSYHLPNLPLLYCLLFPWLQLLLLSSNSLCHIHFQAFVCVVPSFWNAFPWTLSICGVANHYADLNPVFLPLVKLSFFLQTRSDGMFLHQTSYSGVPSDISIIFYNSIILWVVIWFNADTESVITCDRQNYLQRCSHFDHWILWI